MQQAILAKALTKSYRLGEVLVPVLKGIDLEIKKGEFVAIMGASGSGKSTLLNILSLIDVPDSGKLFLDGEDVSQLSEFERTMYRLQKIGIVFQFFNLMPQLTTLENIAYPARIAGLSLEQANSKASELLELVELAEFATHRPRTLSGGQMQRVSIARSLINRPALLFADEPTGNLDSESAFHIIALFRRVNKELGQTIIMVTHERQLAEKTDRIIQLVDGRIVGKPLRTLDTIAFEAGRLLESMASTLGQLAASPREMISKLSQTLAEFRELEVSEESMLNDVAAKLQAALIDGLSAKQIREHRLIDIKVDKLLKNCEICIEQLKKKISAGDFRLALLIAKFRRLIDQLRQLNLREEYLNRAVLKRLGA